MQRELRTAFEVARQGYSADRVVADPEINVRFIAACRDLGLAGPPEELNRALLNARKAGWLTGCAKSRATSFADQREYAFASEIAIRVLERRDNATLDSVICSPQRAQEFDRLAAAIAPGFSPLQYRWAALNLRKRKKLRPEQMSHVLPSEEVRLAPLGQLRLDSVPTGQGLYIFLDRATQQVLYVGESDNLRRRLQKHVEHSDKRELAQWLWQHGTAGIMVEYHVLPSSTGTRARRALEAEMIGSRNPVFNVLGR